MENLEKQSFNRNVSMRKRIQLIKQNLTALNFNWLKKGNIDMMTYSTNLKEIFLAQTFDQLKIIKISNEKNIDFKNAKKVALAKKDTLYREGKLSFSKYKKNKRMIFSFTDINSLTKFFWINYFKNRDF